MNESLGMEDERALFFSPQVGRRRIYRQSISSPQKGLKILSYKKKENAERICDEINKVYNDAFVVIAKEI